MLLTPFLLLLFLGALTTCLPCSQFTQRSLCSLEDIIFADSYIVRVDWTVREDDVGCCQLEAVVHVEFTARVWGLKGSALCAPSYLLC